MISMNTTWMRNLCLTVCLVFLGCAGGLKAVDDRPACFKEIQNTFFRYQTVAIALDFNEVFQNQWDYIARQLESVNHEIAPRMKAKAIKMRPNPLQYPFNGKRAKDLLKETAWELFQEVMVRIEADRSRAVLHRFWRDIFEYIFTVELGRIDPCIRGGGRHRH